MNLMFWKQHRGQAVENIVVHAEDREKMFRVAEREKIRHNDPSVTTVWLNMKVLSLNELLEYVAVLQDSTAVNHVFCDFMCNDDKDVKIIDYKRLIHALEVMRNLKHVSLRNADDNVMVDSFLDAICRNDSVLRVTLNNVRLSARQFPALLKLKRIEILGNCHVLLHGRENENEVDSYVCNVEELELMDDFSSTTLSRVLELLSSMPAFPNLRVLSMHENVALNIWERNDLSASLQTVLEKSCKLEDLHLHSFDFREPEVFETLMVVIQNAPCPKLRWSLDDCRFTNGTTQLFEDIHTFNLTKPMRLFIGKQSYFEHPVSVVLKSVLKQPSCITELAYWSRDLEFDHNEARNDAPMDQMYYHPLASDRSCRDAGLKQICEALERHSTPDSQLSMLTTIELHLTAESPGLLLDLIDSIPQWSYVQTLRLVQQDSFTEKRSNRGLFSNVIVRRDFLQAVRSNTHLQSIDIDANACVGFGAENLARLQNYCERNKCLPLLIAQPFCIPTALWPYALHSAGGTGPNLFYHVLRQMVAYLSPLNDVAADQSPPSAIPRSRLM